MKVVLAQNVSLNNHLGLSTYLLNIAKSLSGFDNIDLRLIIQGPNELPPELANEQVYQLESNTYSVLDNLVYSTKMFKLLRDLDNKSPIDLIHCIYPFSSVLGAILFKRKIRPQVKIIYDIRSPWIENSVTKLSTRKGIRLYKWVAYSAERALSKRVDGYVFITRELRELYRKWLGLPFEPSILIPSGVDLQHFSRRTSPWARDIYGLDSSHFIVGYVGALSKEREMDFIIKAFYEVVKNDSTCRLMIVGDGEDRARLMDFTRELQIEEFVIYTGRIGYDKVPYYISDFDLGVCHLPNSISFRYSFPMKVLEYYSCGTNVVASNIRAHEEIAEQVPLIIYEVDDVSDLARKIMAEKSEHMCRDDCCVDSFSWEKITKNIVQFYEEILAE